MPVGEYERTVKAVNVGYELVVTLTHCFLRSLRRSDLELLVIGAGGGIEIEQFLPSNLGWRITGVDPSEDMLGLARAKAERLAVSDRVSLVRGTVESLPTDARFDAATCLFVLHFLPDTGKSALLRQTAARLRPHAQLLVASGARVDETSLRDEFLGAWQQHGELSGMAADQMAATIRRLMEQQPTMTAARDYVHLLHDAGFEDVAPFLDVMNGGMAAWIAR